MGTIVDNERLYELVRRIAFDANKMGLQGEKILDIDIYRCPLTSEYEIRYKIEWIPLPKETKAREAEVRTVLKDRDNG